MSILKPLSLIIIICFIPIVFVSVIYAQDFEVNEEDYFSSEEEEEQQDEEPEDVKINTDSEDSSTASPEDSEDTDKEPCIDGQIESSAAVLSAISDDSYASNFHFVKKFDKNGNLVDSWGTVGQRMVNFSMLME